ncbi:MAG TPA: HlyD family efflux transporter periplasmic adaptor subunit [Longimicrobium sp.]|jgi:multidrug resistance efflux pump|uniref:HlyD family secretion protein n=1 Tax=Longimicrobium sp. TaxID=2029185 RepID=UPI002EDAA141
MSTARKNHEVIPLRLPHLDDEGQPGAGLVKRSVSITLLTVAALCIAALVVSATVRMDVTVKAAGVLEPVRLWPVRAQASGVVSRVLVRTGDTVQAGTPVLELDGLAMRTQLAQLEAQLRSAAIDRDRSAAATPLERQQQAEKLARARARLTTARATLLQRMVEHDMGENVDSLLAAYRPGQHVVLDLAVGEVRGAQADIAMTGTETSMLALRGYDERKTGTEMQRLQAQIDETRERLGRTVVTAPAAGVVLTDEVERRLPGALIREGETLLEVGDLADWRVSMLIPERDVNKIERGDVVRLEVQAFSQDDRRQLEAHITSIAAEPVGSPAPAGSGAATAPSGPGLYRVVAALDARQADRGDLEQFRRGYSVQANIVTRSGRILELAWMYVRDKLDRR